MAGRARRDTQGQARSSRAASSWPVLAAASGAVSGSDTVTTSSAPSSASSSASSPASTQELPTRATYRSLLIRGLAPDEAANLTAYLAGIGVGGSHWTLRQINQLLFLRQMNRTGHFAESGDRLH